MLLRFFFWLFFFYALWQLVKLVFKVLLRYWLRKNGNRVFYWSSGGGNAQPTPRPEGEIRVDSFGPARPGKGGRNTGGHGPGEYVDYEEVK